MGDFLAFIAAGLLVYLLSRVSSLTKKQNAFIDTIRKLEERIRTLELRQVVSEQKKTEESRKEVPATEPFKKETPKSPVFVKEKSEEKSPEVITPKPVEKRNVVYSDSNTSNTPKPVQSKPPKSRKKNEFWVKLEKQFIENWTGILGSVILVMGVGFLGIYAALKISALGRFLLISGFAGLLSGLFFFLHKKQEWRKLALWLRSSAGAIFLFACVGSIAIPGLKWVETEPLQLLILALGVIVNLFLGYIGKNQGLASLHVLLSLIGVWIIPSSPMLLIVGGIVTLFGVALTYREKWDYHLLLTISSFFVFHLLYWLSLNHVISTYDRIIGIATVLIVGISVALVHYREVYSKKTFERIPFFVHLINWLYFGLSLYLYSIESQLSTFGIAGGAIAAFLLAQKAKKLDIRWLFVTDTLIAQLTAIIALASLYRWQVDHSIILAAIFAECLIFLVVAQKEKDALLYKIGAVTINLVGITLLWFCFVHFDSSNHALLYKKAGSLLASAAFGTVFLFYTSRTNTPDISGLYRFFEIRIHEKTRHPLLAILVGIFFVSYYLHLYHFNWSIYTVVGILLVVLYLRNKVQSREFALISIIFLIGSHFVNWIKLHQIQDQSPVQIMLFGLPILAASALSIKFSFVKIISKHLNWIGVYLIAIQLTIITYLLLHPVSVIAVSCGWLLLSLSAIGIVKFISKKSAEFHQIDRYILHAGYMLIGLFLLRHLAFNLQSEELWGPLKGRIWTEICAFFVFVVWAITRNNEKADYRSWKYLHPVLVELILLFSIFTLAFEMYYRYLPLIWLGIAVVLFAFASWKRESLGRLTLYSFGLFMTSVIHELIIFYEIHATNTPLQTQELILISAFILLSSNYLMIFYKQAQLSNNWPVLVSFLNPVEHGLKKSAAFLGIYLYGAFLLLITYFIFEPVSGMIPGVIWLMLSAVIATFSIMCSGKRFNFSDIDRYMLHLTYLFVVSFLIRHMLVHIQLESYVGIIKTRLLIELLAMGVFAYIATLKKPDTSTYKSWEYLHPLLIELLIVFGVFTIALEVDAIWQPIIWIAMSFTFAFLGNSTYEKLSRLLFYSLVMYWVAAFQTVFITSTYVVPSNEIYAQPWVYGSVSLLFQFGFLLYFYQKCSFEKIVLPKPLVFLTEFINRVQKQRNIYVFYPLIICTAIFFYWTFDKSLLTLLWVIECLAIFIISLVLRKHHFRYVALGALAICIVRLIFFDMAQASTLMRAIVFLSVGIILLLMNSLYTRFKNRFE